MAAKKLITIKLTPERASLLWLNIDGWLDAGACDGGLEPEERLALHDACDQIIKGLDGKLVRNSPGVSDAA